MTSKTEYINRFAAVVELILYSNVEWHRTSLHYAGEQTMQKDSEKTEVDDSYRSESKQRANHRRQRYDGDDHANRRCDFHGDRDAYYDGRARTMCGGTPIGRPSVWICPMRPGAARPAGSADNAAEGYFCPECDWCDYYCLCSVGDEEKRRRLEGRRSRETGFYVGLGRAESAVHQAAATGGEGEEEAAVDDGATLPRGAERVLGAGGRVAVEGGVVAVDEGGQQSTGQALVGEESMDEGGETLPAAGCDDGGQGAGRSDDVSVEVRMAADRAARRKQRLTVRMEDEAVDEADDDEDVAAFGRAFEEGDVRICCSWSAVDGAEADEGTPRCCRWIRREWTAEQLPLSVATENEEERESSSSSSSSSAAEEAVEEDEDFGEEYLPRSRKRLRRMLAKYERLKGECRSAEQEFLDEMAKAEEELRLFEDLRRRRRADEREELAKRRTTPPKPVAYGDEEVSVWQRRANEAIEADDRRRAAEDSAMEASRREELRKRLEEESRRWDADDVRNKIKKRLFPF